MNLFALCLGKRSSWNHIRTRSSQQVSRNTVASPANTTLSTRDTLCPVPAPILERSRAHCRSGGAVGRFRHGIWTSCAFDGCPRVRGMACGMAGVRSPAFTSNLGFRSGAPASPDHYHRRPVRHGHVLTRSSAVKGCASLERCLAERHWQVA
jgi:hypothetical protein